MASGILVLVEHSGGKPKKTAFELIAKAAELNIGPVSAVVIGGDAAGMAAELGSYGASKVYHVAGGDFDTYRSGAWTAALTAAAKAADPKVILGAATPNGKDFLPRAAVRLGTVLGADCTDLGVSGDGLFAVRPMYAGKALAKVEISSTPQMYSVRPNSFVVSAGQGGAAEVVSVSAELTAGDGKSRVVEVKQGAAGKIELTEAERIVAGGRSVKSAEGFDALQPVADVLGAAMGASRAAVDAGYCGHDMQVGQTGKTVNPSLYIAFGISGAIQHLAGMRTSKVIVAVNKDPEAPIFGVADYGIVEDMFEFAPVLADELKKVLAG